MKRQMDIAGSLIGIIFLIPILLAIGAAVRIKLGSPVLFKQVRAGMGGKSFSLYKFRTMSNQTDQDGKLLADHIRLSPFGRWIREKSLDELPQLFNVLKGDISLVGPRPLLMEYVELYTPLQARRLEVKPGITGWAQINGRNSISWEEKFELDLWYIKNHSVLLDIKIIFLTVIKVFKKEGITQRGHVSMDKFGGSREHKSSKSDAI